MHCSTASLLGFEGMFERYVRCPRMPVVESGCGASPQDPSESPALPAQQTCERLLAPVAHLSTGGVAHCSSALHPVCEMEGGRRDGEKTGELMLDAALVVGGARAPELDRLGPVQLDSFLDLRDSSQPQDDLEEGVALPGQVAEDPPVYTPSFCRRTRLDLCSRPGLEPRPRGPHPAVQAQTEEVQPFCLEASFDYDQVVLSRKHPAL